MLLRTCASQLYFLITAISLLSLAFAVSYYIFGHRVLPLGNFLCFGTQNRVSKPFAELQGEQLVALVFEEAELVHQQETAFQFIQVYSHPYFGSILAIDGSLQITVRDEHIYHEMMVHVPMAYLAAPLFRTSQKNNNKNVKSNSNADGLRIILIGGGDGGANTQLFKYPGVQSVFHIDIDMKAMRDVTQSYFPHLYASFLDPRLQTFSYDGSQWIKERIDDASQKHSFDLVIVDSTDYGSAETLFTNDFYENLKLLLRGGSGNENRDGNEEEDARSILLLNLDSPQWNVHIVATVQQQLARMFKYVYVYTSAQPSFLSGSYSFLMCSDNVHPMKSGIDWARFKQFNIYSHYYTPDLHYGSFLLPADLSRRVSMAGQLKDVPAFSASEEEHKPWPKVDVAPERLEPSAASLRQQGDQDEESDGDGGDEDESGGGGDGGESSDI